MITTIILLLIFIVLFVIYKRVGSYSDAKFYSGLITMIVSVFFMFHVLFYHLQHLDYEMDRVKRETFQQTLNTSRELGNEYESATITKDVVEFNVSLARIKEKNTWRFIGQYIDDRYMNLKPIE